jgi:hypothetical protein
MKVAFTFFSLEEKKQKNRDFQRQFLLQRTADKLREALRSLLCSFASIAAENLTLAHAGKPDKMRSRVALCEAVRFVLTFSFFFVKEKEQRNKVSIIIA